MDIISSIFSWFTAIYLKIFSLEILPFISIGTLFIAIIVILIVSNLLLRILKRG